jgi:hypothetical protein
VARWHVLTAAVVVGASVTVALAVGPAPDPVDPAGGPEVSRGDGTTATDAAGGDEPEVTDDDAPAPVVSASREVTQETLWLCGPDAEVDACAGDLDATVVSADGSRSLEPFVPAADPPVDCFYVYPTVSQAATRNAPLEIGDAEREVARVQAARFGEVCRVIAPVYRQVTLQGLVTGGFADPEARDLAFGDVLSAWNDHVATSGDRPFVLLGHSQGAHELTRLLAERIEGDPRLRPRLISALLLGGQVEVPVGEDVGGTFQTVTACRATHQTGCVVAYNSFAEVPPAFALFGRGDHGMQVLCVHPGALAGGSAPLTPYLPTANVEGFDTPFVTAEDAVTGECRSEGTASWLHVDIDPALGLDRAAAGSDLGAAWGLHAGDVNLALGDLVALVRAQFDAAS